MNSMREHAELLSSVRDDISEYKVIMAKLKIILLYFYHIVYFLTTKSILFAFLAGIWEYVT